MCSSSWQARKGAGGAGGGGRRWLFKRGHLDSVPSAPQCARRALTGANSTHPPTSTLTLLPPTPSQHPPALIPTHSHADLPYKHTHTQTPSLPPTGMGAAVAHGHAKALSRPDHDVGTPLAGGRQLRQRQQVGGHAHLDLGGSGLLGQGLCFGVGWRWGWVGGAVQARMEQGRDSVRPSWACSSPAWNWYCCCPVPQ